MKRKFPGKPPFKEYIQLDAWKKQPTHFFFNNKKDMGFPKNPSAEIANNFKRYQQGIVLMFHNIEMNLGKDYDWITNPDTGYRYDNNKHWTAIADYSTVAGDIKYVWEKSRFSFLYDIIRYDYHFNEDCADIVFNEIISWIDANPVNCGPNYRCSQEISLRVLNWTFALHYYKDAAALTPAVFQKMQYAIYWQMEHVYHNIDFSRIAVRNNHAITETLTLYLAGMFYPDLPNAEKWKIKGKKWFEEEIAYQVYEDGTFLQFSMNYHRVVIQLLTWAIVLAEKNKERFADVVYQRAKKSLLFLRVCMNDSDGRLPNYGANDGALFFKLSDTAFRDYRPQLEALGSALHINCAFKGGFEDKHWYGIAGNKTLENLQVDDQLYAFEQGGYYLFRETDSLTFIRCGKHKDRPSQADNLHIDVFYKGENILMDGGSYKYNTDEKTLRYFMGTASHNTIMLNDADQMKKGTRFIWYHWTQATNVFCESTNDAFHFKGSITAFQHLADNIIQTREVIKKRGVGQWIIKDNVTGKPKEISMRQLWHLSPLISATAFKAVDELNLQVVPTETTADIAALYGTKKPFPAIIFETKTNEITTTINLI